ncbi:BTAD domain-containing putative transcriptional regulator [Actinocrispum sp. NPDC049592]|uniref:BTAD domain-containing putative transcriptional regulator n=1 Tax=Actinocrispum sp. NPDC049592 TaxID=3154835 RepID=UPI003434A201
MHVGILGPLSVTADGTSAEIGGVRLRVLLTRLAVAVPRVVTVDELADALWPEERPADHVSAVRTLVSRLRRSLPDPEAVKSAPGGYRLDLPVESVDALWFDQLARSARRELAKGDPAAAAGLLRTALKLWRGPALADAARHEFAVGYIAGLDEARLTAIEDLAEADLYSGQSDVSGLAELAAKHPLRERLQGLLLRALSLEGRHAEALAGYEEVRRRLAEELGADPGPELQQVHQALLQGPPAKEKPRTGNLRLALTSFIGRAKEVGQVGKLLADNRLVTLVGPGGAGKTRLATTVAAGLAASGGVWLVELAPVTDPSEVHLAVLGALGLRDARGTEKMTRDPMSRLVDLLARQETVLVLDNCEHVVAAAAQLAEDLLSQCRQLKVLATSREPLGVFSETLCPVTPFAIPGTDSTLAEAMENPAVRLLAERAAAVRPGFEVTGDTVGAVVEICRRLDGLPLAIELAAARLRTLTPVQLAERLDDRFRLLTGGSRTSLPRHQTLNAVVAWSWDLLDEEERRFAERLAVFPAGIALDAAEQVHGDTALSLLTALVDKSLLQVVDGPSPRYRMLETIREFALARLADRGEVAAAKAAHMAYFLKLAEQAEPHIRGRDQLAWANVLTAERDNLVAALHFAAATEDADTAIRIAAALCMFWTIRNTRAESVAWLELALNVPGESPHDGRTLVTAMYLVNKAIAGGYDRLEDIVEPFKAIVAEAGTDPDHPMLALLEPMLGLFMDDVDYGVDAVDRRLGHPDPWTRAALWMLRANMLENEGDLAGLRRDMPIAIAGFREVGDRFGLSQSLTSLADAQLYFGEPDAAIEGLEEAVRLLHELDADDVADHERILLASAWLQKGDAERARTLLVQLTADISPTYTAAFAWAALGDLARRDGDFEEAERYYAVCTSAVENAPFLSPQFRALQGAALALLAVARDEPDAARQHVDTAIKWAMEARDMPVLARVGVSAAVLQAGLGLQEVAATTLGAAARLRGAPDHHNPDIMALVDQLRTGLGGAAYDAAYATGLAMDRAGAIAQVRRR